MKWRTRGGPHRRARALSIHTRLFLGFGAALAACSALMVAIIYVGIRYLPTYDFTAPYVVPPGTTAPPDLGEAPQGRGRTIDVSGLIRDKEDVWSTVLAVSVGGVIVVLGIGLGAGWLLSRRLLAPLHTINRAAAKAGEGDLAYRIAARGPEDELKQLADTFDTTLERLEESFAAHQRFAANASHELLTPLATTRAILQMAEADGGTTREEFAELIPMLRETNERNIEVVRALLRLAAAEQGDHEAEPVDLAALTERAVAERADAERPAEVSGGPEGPYGVTITLAPGNPGTPGSGPGSCEVVGSATLLRQLVVNLLDNARTHNVPDGTVEVRVGREEREERKGRQGREGGEHRAGHVVVLTVANTGPEVDPATVHRLFEPFYRARPRVASDRSGHGLGLALVRSIARGHHGTVTARAREGGGLLVRVELPAREPIGPTGPAHEPAGPSTGPEDRPYSGG
ncbi:sensor histidine kinase [Streptomyces sp. NPDC090025]|uniref:sensor histidine kinase n=1 Tax=Streptomyces sp. NPDC090025 TaxID=3365922 RepID=UPI0038331586